MKYVIRVKISENSDVCGDCLKSKEYIIDIDFSNIELAIENMKRIKRQYQHFCNYLNFNEIEKEEYINFCRNENWVVSYNSSNIFDEIKLQNNYNESIVIESFWLVNRNLKNDYKVIMNRKLEEIYISIEDENLKIIGGSYVRIMTNHLGSYQID